MLITRLKMKYFTCSPIHSALAIATSALLMTAVSEAANIAITDVSHGGPLTTTFNVAAGNFYQPGTGSVIGTLNINAGGSLVFTNPDFQTIIQQNAAGTSTININTGGMMDFSGATGNGASLWLGNNIGTAIGIINVQGGALNGSGLTDIVLGRAGAVGQMNISAGTVTIADSTPLFGSNSYINFANGSTGTLAFTGANQAFYQNLWNSNNLRFDGVNTGTFTDHFAVTGNVLSAVPEPSTALLGGLGMLGLLTRRRRQIAS